MLQLPRCLAAFAFTVLALGAGTEPMAAPAHDTW